VSGAIALLALTYLLLGNLLFKFIIPFCEPTKYIFIGVISLVFGFFPTVITATRSYSIFSHSDQVINIKNKNINFFASIFYPYIQQDQKEQTTLETQQIS
jgi:hypothetical protein